MLKLSQDILGLQIQLDKLAGDDLKALSDQIKYIDGQTLENLRGQFKSLQDDLNKQFAALGTNWFLNLLGKGDNAGIENLKQGWEELTARVLRYKEAGDSIGASNEIQYAIAKVTEALSKPIKNDTFKEALEDELDLLGQMAQRYESVNQAGDMSKQIAQITEANALWKQQIDLIDRLEKETKALLTSTNIEGTPEQIQKVLDLIQAWKSYQGQLSDQGKISATANADIEALGLRLDEYKEHVQGVIDRLSELSEADRKALESIAADAAKFAQTKPAFGDTVQEQRYQAALLGLRQEMADGKITADEYAQSVQQLRFEFGEGGAATGVKQFFAEFQQGRNTAKETFDLLRNSLDGFEQNLAETLATGKANWANFFASVEEMILKSSLSTLFSSALGFLNNSNLFSGLGGGSLFGSGGIFGGIGAPHAAGGPVEAGTLYPIGEQGPEYFRPSVPGTIIPNGGLKGGSKSTTVVNNHFEMHIATPDADSFKKSAPQIQADMYRRAGQAHGRFSR
ncbi:MAG: phage tail tape measure C-terminal domain-containing protein [Terriglobales bacterium]